MLIPRLLRPRVEAALADTRVVMVAGARQVGKSTIVGELARERRAVVRTLDDHGTRELARADPRGFIVGLGDGLVVIDEVQRAPGTLLAIKMEVDRDPRPGRFLLTGSANVLTLPAIADAPTGRIELTTLWPLSQAEIERSQANLVDALFAVRPPQVSGAPVGRAAWVARAVAGGHLEARVRRPHRRAACSRAISRPRSPGTWRTSRRSGRPGDAASFGSSPRRRRTSFTGARSRPGSGSTRRPSARTRGSWRPCSWVGFLPGWRPGLGAREVQAPKVYVSDSGLLAHLLGVGESRACVGRVGDREAVRELRRDGGHSGPGLGGRSRDRVSLPRPGLPARRGGRPRARGTQRRPRRDRGEGGGLGLSLRLRGTRTPPRPLGTAAPGGRVVYAGEQTLPFGDHLWALPVAALWAG